MSLIIFLSAVEAGILCECQSIQFKRVEVQVGERIVNKINRSTVKTDQWVLQKLHPVVEVEQRGRE